MNKKVVFRNIRHSLQFVVKTYGVYSLNLGSFERKCYTVKY